jgi:hypothetical protein
MGPNKFVHLTFAIAAIVVAFVLARAIDWGWSYFAKPSDFIVNVIAIAVAGGAALAVYRNENAYASVVEVTRELENVIVSALVLSGFDAIWAFFTNWFLR